MTSLRIFSRSVRRSVRRSHIPARLLATDAVPVEKKVKDEAKPDGQFMPMRGWELDEENVRRQGLSQHRKGPLTGAFGTVSAPTIIPSKNDSRVVGCVGGGPAPEHPITFFNVIDGPKHACPDCGQIFLLQSNRVTLESTIVERIPDGY